MFGVIRKAGEKFNEINGQSSGPAAKKAAPAVRRRR
jgi:hypothetical protein